MLAYAGPRLLLAIGLAIGLPGVVVALSFPPGGAFSLVHVMPPLLFAFGCFKGAMGIDALLQRRRDPQASERLAHHHGSQRAVSGWIVYKLLAMAMAFFGATVCLIIAL